MIDTGSGEQTSARSQRRTRRHLLAGGAAAVGAVAAEALARATPAAAANGDPITMGQLNQASSNTSINNNGGDTTFTALGTVGGTALEGDAVDGTGVSGTSVTGIGVSGTTGSTAAGAAAVAGEITSTSPGSFSAGVRGKNAGTGANGVGVLGSHGGDGWGVYGASQGGIGVFGNVTTGTGVEGSGTTGVFGVTSAQHGVGVLAQNNGGGPALKVNGVAAFSRSGVATVPPGKSQVAHGLPLTSASFVLATIQGNVTGLYVRGVTIAAGSPGSFTIHLSKAVKSKTNVAWLAVN
jgi:hypothetical protein